MTRRLAKETVYKEGIDVGVDRIYDEMRSRTCENCKWFNSVYCTNEFLEGYFEIINHKDFGCNKFVRKDT